MTDKLKNDIILLRATGGAPGVAEHEIDDLALAVATMLPVPYTFGALENALHIILQKRRGAAIASQMGA